MKRRAIFTRTFWLDCALDARRFGRDKRARRSFVFRNLAVIYCIAVLSYYWAIVHSLHDPGTEIALAVILAIIGGIIGAVRWSQYRESRRQLAVDIASAPPHVTAHLQRLTHGLAAVSERALGELWLKKNTLPEGHSVLTRRIQIDALKARGVWDDLPAEVRDWMIRPDGSWPDLQIASVLASAETLNTLLWTLGLARELRPVNSLVEPLRFDRLAKALKKPAPGVRPTWDLRVARNDAQQYFIRCYAENIHRGVTIAKTDEQREAVEEWIKGIQSGDHPDALAGSETIGEIEASTLDLVGRSAARRVQALSLVMELLDGEDRWINLTNAVYSSFISQTETLE
jgi:hypothetical protein